MHAIRMSLALVSLVGALTVAAPATAQPFTTVALPAGYTINGIDVSSHDHANGKTVNWAAQKAAGDEFAYVKATEGTSYTNPYFDQDYNGAKASGLYVGAYAFGRPDLGNPVGQANFFADTLQWATDGKTLPPFLDMEWPYASLGLPACYGLSQSAMRDWISAFLTQLQARIGGRKPMIYTNVNWWNPCTGNSTAFSGYLLDISSCNASPPSVPGWRANWTFWQYDIPGCGRGGTRDSNVFNGTLADLAALAGAPKAIAGALGNLDGSGKVDMLAMVENGDLYVYPNIGPSGTTQWAARSLVCSGCGGFDSLSVGDLNSDGKADLMVRDSAGSLWVYPNVGAPGSTQWGARYQVCSGCGGWRDIN